MSDYSRISYEFYKKNRICVSCRRQKTNGKIIRCDSCRDKYNRNDRIKTKKLKIQESLIYCNKCKKNVVKFNGLCDKCYEEVVIPEFIRGKNGKTKR